MQVKTGIDILHLPTFSERFNRTSGQALVNVFSESELQTFTSEVSRAGAFCAKEAVLKACGIPVGNWHDIYLSKTESGKPVVKVKGHDFASADISISHHKDYCVAVAIFVTV